MGNTKLIAVEGFGHVDWLGMRAAARADAIALTLDAEGYFGYPLGPWFIATLHSHSMVAVPGLQTYLCQHCTEFRIVVWDRDFEEVYIAYVSPTALEESVWTAGPVKRTARRVHPDDPHAPGRGLP